MEEQISDKEIESILEALLLRGLHLLDDWQRGFVTSLHQYISRNFTLSPKQRRKIIQIWIASKDRLDTQVSVPKTPTVPEEKMRAFKL